MDKAPLRINGFGWGWFDKGIIVQRISDTSCWHRENLEEELRHHKVDSSYYEWKMERARLLQ